MGHKIGEEPPRVRTPRENALKLDDALEKRLSPAEMSVWRKQERDKIIGFWERHPKFCNWRIMKNIPKEGKKVIKGKIVDVYLVEHSNASYGYRPNNSLLYVIINQKTKG